jgi:hypothetical protein
MCDIPQEDVAEYLLWLEVESARTPARPVANVPSRPETDLLTARAGALPVLA